MKPNHATPDFPAWNHRLSPMGARTRTALGRVRQLTLTRLEQRLAPCLPGDLLQKPASGDHSRDRIYSLPRTFWCWVWQMLNANAPCREVVRQVQALFTLEGGPEVDQDSGGYCQARQRLPQGLLERALSATAQCAARRAPQPTLLRGRSLKAVDGSSLRLPDTPRNQKRYPQPLSQKPGCGFPVLRLVVLFCLASGAVVARSTGSLWDSESRLFHRLLPTLKPGDIVLGDRGFGNFVILALLSALGVDFVGRVALKNRHVDFRRGRRLGTRDRCLHWRKGDHLVDWLTAAAWAALPREISVRVLQLRVHQSGFRVREITLVTTLLDPQLYPAQELLEAYLRRWRLEMCLDDLKTTLGLEHLKCLTPAMVEKELLIGLISHNLLRCVMAQAAQQHSVPLERISFKGSLDALRQFSIALSQARSTKQRRELWEALLDSLASDLVPQRPGRCEPRAVKRRPKYPLLTHPRHVYTDRPRRSLRKTRSRLRNA
jgi:hypothetical protein